MTDTKISNLTALAGTALATADEFVVVDKSDTTMAASGTDKRITTDGIFTRPSCGVARTTDQAVNDATSTPISWNSELYDNAAMWASSPNPTRITVPIAGVYLFSVLIAWNFGVTAGDIIGVSLKVNNTTTWYLNEHGKTIASVSESGSYPLKLAANDYVEVIVYQNSTGSQNILGGYTSASVQYLGTG